MLKTECKNKGLRLTKQRKTILDVVKSSCAHLGADEVHKLAKEKMPEISLDTVYRNLQILEELGLIFRIDSQIPYARFDGDLRPHSHFICQECNKVIDIFEEIDEPNSHYLEFGEVKRINRQVIGICNSCIERRKSCL